MAPDRSKPIVRAVDLGGRTPPHNWDAEAAVLSAVMSDARALDVVIGMLEAEDFYSDANKRVFDAVAALHARGAPVDPMTVAAELKDRDRLQAIGGAGYINKLIDATPAVVNVAAHAKIVLGKARRRRFIETCQMLAAAGYGDVGDEQQWMAEGSDSLARVAALTDGHHVRSVRELVHLEEERLAQIAAGKIAAGGIFTGYGKLDRATTGLYPGEVVVVGAKPGIGKTAFAGSLAVNVASNEYDGARSGVLIFSLEMPQAQIVRRMAAAAGELNSMRIRVGKLSPGERDRLTHGHARIEPLPIYVDDSATHRPSSIRATIRQHQAKHDRDGVKLRMVIVDYLTLLEPDRRERGMTNEQLVGQIAQSLRIVARECGVVVVELAQLKKNAADSKDTLPDLSDLRESGQIEAAAHHVWFLHRPEYYIADDDEVSEELRGVALLRVAKTRDGQKPLVKLRYTDWCTRFDNFESPRRVEQTDEPTQQALIA